MPNQDPSFHIDSIDFDPEGLELITALHHRYSVRCHQVFMGRNRNVFDMGRYVVKVPKNLDGFADNDWEGSVSNANEDPDEIRYARTRMAYFADIPVVFMEYAEHADTQDMVSRLGQEPAWVGCVDCGQVGFTRDGRLVAYDYGVR